jgi:hypothetical protein
MNIVQQNKVIKFSAFSVDFTAAVLAVTLTVTDHKDPRLYLYSDQLLMSLLLAHIVFLHTPIDP